ncbi:MAG: hypothetical protein UR25_C0001G0139 [Candidatus Nomurabacteria bacterium GW2011_GWE1_32_28]|uniref:DUF5666 domain-containing protein n=1 Tax=Candidatus Nomurabacteria bacterium GW2011_GWF1_31_48 TaxID=1618767 RepID=A0A0F9YH22_9BACT|nr:MAG: hypothetical protein UR10_C0001G0092 [Candidatus Nomurabacteria bacterium GW2011_GWF2_30_133]KKP28970.1 MAG: hypothetical protein UR18_C0001G0091 [Candidatus Nomurabacteria bacterium GW2011_GWE2_31_40]KKP30708.1 MAG: hypothetical protein UR19_C0001G0092 [Candidatus Nomurabacteria bacterium GW2011_GWF1_31_48]KKP35226.1 MAG: hypothetical protein UR25_C0001G0139 [Candidatus Nomurabacteria bacterium GW2011_GWE1_32_28]HAS80533.1 hypothetical protein [Candidatus Nomurabacteria bacterium]
MKKIYEDIKKVFDSKVSVGFIYGIAAAIIMILIFSIGVSVGFHKASFGQAWGENYERNFGMMPGGMMFNEDNFPNAHGAIGKIIKIELPTIIVQDKDNIEKVVLIKDDTQIQEKREDMSVNNLKIDDFIVVIGNPNEQGQIEAKLIRIMPSPELIKNTDFRLKK